MPNIIISSGYIKSTEHYLNYLIYSGEKLEAQTLVFEDGTNVEVDPDEKIDAYAIKDLKAVKIEFKDGTSRSLSPSRYQKFTEQKEDGYVEHTLVLEDGTEKALTPELYLKYMGERPSVEKDEDFGHGLFDMDGIVDMQKERQRVIENDGSVKWSHIVSLSREDAERTGFDNRQAWQNLIRAKAYNLARIYNISPENLVVNAAFHDKAHHPHIHLFFYSTDKREGTFAGKDALVNKTEKMKSLFNNTIFSGDAAYLKEEKQEYKKAFQKEMEQITKAIGRKGYEPHPDIEEAFTGLSDSLLDYTGRPFYQYLQPEIKLQVQDVLKKCVELDPNLNKIFSRTCDNQKAFISMYADDEEKINKRLESFKKHFFTPDGKNDSRTLHNIIIKNAMLYNQQRAPGAHVVRKKEPSTFSNKLILPDDTVQSFTLDTIVDRKNETLTFSNEAVFPDKMEVSTPSKGVVRKEENPYPPDEVALPNNVVTSSMETDVVRKKEFQCKNKDDKNFPANHLELYQLGKRFLTNISAPKDIKKAVSNLEASAEQGNQFAQYTLGKLYLADKDVSKDINKAIPYLEASAGQGNEYAQYTLGKMYLDNENVEKALPYLIASAAEKPTEDNGKALSGNQFAQYTLGKLYLSDENPQKDIPKALEYLTASAEQDNQYAQYALGRLYLDGKEVPKDVNKALEYLTTSAAERLSDDEKEELPGNQFAQYALGMLYLAGEDVPKDVEKALSYLEASARQDNQFAQYRLGKLYLEGKDVPKNIEKALSYLNESAAERFSDDEKEILPGNQFAQYTLGKLYLEGIEAPKDINKALTYLEHSAKPRPSTEKDPGDSGNEYAQYTLGKLYLAGEDVPKDINKALMYLNASAAERLSKDEKEVLPGNQFAQYTLGKLYLEGTEVEKDVPQALEYLNKSADQGNQFAQYTLGMTYYKGIDVPKNKLLANEYFSKASSQGNDYAKTMLKVMKSKEMQPAYAACHMLFQLGNTMAGQTNQNLSPDINNQKDKNKNPTRFKTKRRTKKKAQSIPRENPMEY